MLLSYTQYSLMYPQRKENQHSVKIPVYQVYGNTVSNGQDMEPINVSISGQKGQ